MVETILNDVCVHITEPCFPSPSLSFRFTFMSTRNNNFSNRRQVMQIEVTGGRWNSAGSVRASIVLVAVLAVTVLLAIF